MRRFDLVSLAILAVLAAALFVAWDRTHPPAPLPPERPVACDCRAVDAVAEWYYDEWLSVLNSCSPDGLRDAAGTGCR